MTREQKRSLQAFEDVQDVNKLDESKQKRYATVVYQLLSLIHSAGMLQAIEFIRSMSNEEKQEAGGRLLGSLATQMSRIEPKIKDKNIDTLSSTIRETDLATYMLLSREMVATLVWYKRFVQSILKIDASSAQED